jgi:tape measure domain-containing protein
MADSRVGIIIEAQDRATSALKNISGNLDQMQKRIEKQAQASRQFALALGAAGAAVGAFGVMSLRAAGDMEQTQVAFETMLGSAENAAVFIEDLIQFAKTTPFELRGLETASKQLLAYGFQQEEVLPNLKALGDIASGVGMDKLPNLILAFGQVKAATRLTGMELRQFTEAGVPMLQMLSDQMGVSVATIQEMVSAGEIGFPAVQEALIALTSEGGRFNNLMDKQSQTLGGLVSNLQDAWDIFLREQGAKLLEWAKKFTQAAIHFVENVLPVWIDRIDQLIQFFEKHQYVLYIVAGAIVGALVPAVYAAALAFAAWAIALAPFIIGGAIIGALVAGIVWIVQNWDMLKDKASQIWGAIGEFIGGVITKIGTTITGWLNKIREAWEFTLLFLREFALNLFGLLLGSWLILLDTFFPSWQEKLQMLADFFTLIFTTMRDFFVEIWNGIIEYFSNKILQFTAVATPVFNAFKEFWAGIWAAVSETFTTVWQEIKDFFASVVDFIVDKVDTVVSAINKVLRPLREAAELTGGVFSSISSSVSDGFNSVIERGRGVIGLAEGGIVTRPTLAVVGEGGEPEAVVPLSKLGRMSGGGVTININGGTFMSREAAQQLGNELIDILQMNMRS